MGNKHLIEKLPSPPKGKKGWPWDEETSPDIYKDLEQLPKISIVTPSFNQGMFIEQTIRSVLLQNYPNLEYIIIDGGSTDDTVETINKYSPWLKYWVSEKDKGQSEAINKGIMKCEGEIFNWLNSDDYYYKNSFKLIAENFADKNAYIVAGNYRFFDDSDNTKDKTIDIKLGKSLEETIALVLINQPSTFFRLEIFKKLGNLNERLQCVMDQDIWKKYLFKYGQENIKVINKDIANFRLHEHSKTSQLEFNTEYAGILYSIAAQAGMVKHLKLLKKIEGEEADPNYVFNMDLTENNIRIAKKVINILIYFNARKAYNKGDIELLNECLDTLETEWLNNEQKRNILKLKIKSKLIKYNLSPLLKLFEDEPKKSNLKKA